MKLRNIFLGVAAATAFAFTTAASAQKFPDKLVTVVMPYASGSGPDALMRHLSEKLSALWGQPVIVNNKPGGNAWIAVDAVKRAPADGYTVLLIDSSVMSYQPHLYSKLPFDPLKDFDAVSPVYQTHFFLVVSPNSPWTSVGDMLAAAKAKPLDLTYGSWGIGSHAHLGAAMLESTAGVNIRHIPFKDTMQVLTSVATGDINWAFGTAGSAGPLQRAGRVKFLAYAAPQRNPNFPNIPTVRESGGPADFQLKSWVGLFAPRGTPKAVVERLNADVTKALAEPDIRERLAGLSFSDWQGTPAELTRALNEDYKAFGESNRKLKISLD